MAATLLLGRCDPYGAETGGPRYVMGGLHGPASAATPDMDLPDNVAQGEWTCPQPAQVRVRMTCRCGHTGRIMELCSEHDETVFRSDPLNFGRTLKETIRVRGHFEEIQRRQSSGCTRCLYPGAAPSWHHEIMTWQGELAWLHDTRQWMTPRRIQVQQHIVDLVARFDEANATGQIHRCPMRLIPVS